MQRRAVLVRPACRVCASFVLAMCAVARMAAQSTAAGAETEVVSRYVWRGVPYSDGAVVQPSGWVSLHGLTAGLWSNLVVADRVDRGHFNHLFLTATWRADVQRLSFEPGVQVYHTKAVGEVGAVTSTEGVVRVSAAAGSFRLFTDHTVDVHTYRGAYIGDAGLIHRASIRPRVELATQFLVSWASARYNSAFVGVPKAAVNYASVGGRMTVGLDKHWSLRPHAEWQPVIDRAIRRALDANGFFTAGVAVSLAY
jgi:hypothetical protein